MNQMKISTRLSCVFGLLIALVMAMAGVAFVEFKAMRGAASDISDSQLPSVQAVGALDGEVALLRLTIMEHLLTMDPSVKDVLNNSNS